VTTFATMKTRIVDETLRDDLTATQLNNAINQAISQWESERFVFNEKRYRINTVASTEYYDMSGSTLLVHDGSAVGTGELILELDDITCVVNSQPYRLIGRTQQWFNENQSSSYTGQPQSYTLYGNQLRLFPIPDAVYALYPSGLARLSPNPLSADGDTNAWLTEAEPLIRQHAKMVLYRDVVRDAEGGALAVEGMKEAEHMLKRKMAAKAFIGTQRAWTL